MLKLSILSLKGFAVPREEKNEIDSADRSDDRPRHRRWMCLEIVLAVCLRGICLDSHSKEEIDRLLRYQNETEEC